MSRKLAKEWVSAFPECTAYLLSPRRMHASVHLPMFVVDSISKGTGTVWQPALFHCVPRTREQACCAPVSVLGHDGDLFDSPLGVEASCEKRHAKLIGHGLNLSSIQASCQSTLSYAAQTSDMTTAMPGSSVPACMQAGSMQGSKCGQHAYT